MNYRFGNFNVKTISFVKNGERHSQKVLLGIATNPFNRFEPPHLIAIETPEIVEKYESLLPTHLGGLIGDANWREDSLSSDLRVLINSCTEEYDLGDTYCGIYFNEKNYPFETIKKEDIIQSPYGEPYVFRRIYVFCRYESKKDESGKPLIKWLKDWGPYDRGEMIKKYLVKYSSVKELFNKNVLTDSIDTACSCCEILLSGLKDKKTECVFCENQSENDGNNNLEKKISNSEFSFIDREKDVDEKFSCYKYKYPYMDFSPIFDDEEDYLDEDFFDENNSNPSGWSYQELEEAYSIALENDLRNEWNIL